MARTMSRRRKGVIVGFAAAFTLAGAGIAFAYWTSTGTGDGTADTGATVAFTITAEAPVGTITPGGAGQTVDFTVTNPGPGIQYLSTVTATLADAAGVAWVPPAGCLIADYAVTMTTPVTAGNIAPVGTEGGTVTVTLTNTGVDQNACQGVDVPLHFAAA
jgi:hypothetical protein